MGAVKIFSPVDGETGKRRELSKEEVIDLFCTQAETINEIREAIPKWQELQHDTRDYLNKLYNNYSIDALDAKMYHAMEKVVKENIDVMSNEITKEIKKNVKKQIERHLLKQYYKPKELAVYFNVSITTIYDWIKAGKIQAVRLANGREHQISKTEIENFEKKYAKKV